jgi:WD domain, G-beta repeat
VTNVQVKGVQPVHDAATNSAVTLQVAGLTAVYSMHFSSPSDSNSDSNNCLLAAGGKGGIVAIFTTASNTTVNGSSSSSSSSRDYTDTDSSDSSSDATLMNFRAHKGWVSAVQFIASGTDNSSSRPNGCQRLLTSGNDGLVRLWDVNREKHGMPYQIAQAANLHSKGIFSMHCCSGVIATASKDKTVGK